VAYATPAKATLLGVDGGLLERTGPVHADVAAAMARGVRDRFGATYGVATTGVAGPEPQGGQPVGTVFVAVAAAAAAEAGGAGGEVAGHGEGAVRHAVLRRAGGREVVRRRAVVAALDLLRRTALGISDEVGESLR
jgi:PncC family amidohydrolase